MQKLKYQVLDKMIDCTSAEIDFLIYISHYQNEKGVVEGVYYKDICENLLISHTTFYDLKTSLINKNIIKVSKESYTDWDIQILDNDFSEADFNNLADNDKYINMSENMFSSEEFFALKANEKLLAMHILKISKSGRGCYTLGVDKFYEKYTKLFNVTKRIIQNYLKSLKTFFSVGIEKSVFWIRPLEKVFKKHNAPSDAKLYNNHIGKTICRREKITYTQNTLRDTVDLIKQYGTVLKDKTIALVYQSIKKSIAKANEDVKDIKKWIRKLNPALIHKLLIEEIESQGITKLA